MAKVRVQDATKELSANVGQLYDSVSKAHKRALEMLNSLKKLEETAKQKEQERKAQEEAKQHDAAAALTGGAYTAEPPVVPAEAPKAPAAQTPSSPAPAENTDKNTAQRPAARPQGQYGRPVQGDRPQGQYGRPVQGDRPQGQYGRPVQGDRPQGQYGRPVQGDRPQGQFGRPVQGDRPQGQFGRGAQGDRPQGDRPQGQFGRPVQGDRPQGDRPQGDRPQGDRPQGGFNRDRAPQQRDGGMSRAPQQGGSAPRQGGGFGRKIASELAPAVEKERVSNYDPNKKNYVRTNDPERVAKNRKQLAKENINGGGYDDDFQRGKKSKKKQQSAPAQQPQPVKIEKAYMTAEKITVKDLSERIGKQVSEIIKQLMLMGTMATINAELDYDNAALVAAEFGIELELKLEKTAEDVLDDENFEDKEEERELRNPVVTIMGHVDHGKTSLLDYIRKTRVTAGEAGGITQHIGAYTVEVGDKGITFLDTPGHEAFTAMRARGAMATDIAVLVVAADDGVMPQTIESISHAKAAKVPVIVAINKCDKPTADPDRIRQTLTEHNLVPEEWGGETIMVEVSARTGAGIDDLLENILLVAEVQDLRANPNRKARGSIIEAKLDKNRGPVATVLVQNGTLKVGDTIIAGTAYGRVRAMMNDRGERVQQAGPSTPVEVIGFGDVPSAGDIISAVDDDRLSRQVAEERKDKLRAALIKSQQKTTLDDLFNQISAGQVKDLNIIVKADVQGSVEAVKQSLEKISNEEVRVRCIHGGVGAITETDVMLASASNAIIIGFNVRHDNNVRDVADREKVDIRLYRVIYSAIEDIENAMKGLLAPKFEENVLGTAQVRQVFKISGVGMTAGCYVTDGKLQRNAQVRLLRDNVVITESKIASLRRFKDDAKEVAAGYECGVVIENYSDIKENDVIECFLMEEIEK